MVSERTLDFGEVDLGKHDVRAYLIKMPEFLMREFESDTTPGQPARNRQDIAIGRLHIPDVSSMAPTPFVQAVDEEEEQDPPHPRARIIIDNPIDPSEGNPREFELHFPDDPGDIVLLSWKPHGEDPAVRLEGRVQHQCVARPKLDESYRKLNRQRVEEATQVQRETVYMDEGERIDAQNKALRLTAVAETDAQREEKQKKKEASRRHLGLPDDHWKEAAKTAIFRAFESRLHYTADHLARDIDEPLSRLRSIINEVCFYNKSGPFSGKYELKDEFKTVAQRELKEQQLEDYKLATIEDVKRRREERAVNEKERAEPHSKKHRRQ